MKLRPATMEDAKLLLAWRNDPETRKASINTEEVTWDGHIAWLKRTLNDQPDPPNRYLFVAEEEGTPVGTVRLDRLAEDQGGFELSWTVAPEARGRGVGRQMVETATKLPILLSERFIARIKPDNLASLKIVAAVGFIENGIKDGLIVWSLDR